MASSAMEASEERRDRQRKYLDRALEYEAQGEVVYFVECQETGRIKIGQSQEPERRLYDLRCASPTELELLGTTEGVSEVALHDEFSADWLHGEWFAPSEALHARIEELTSDG